MRKYLLASTLFVGLLSSHAALAVCQGASGYPFNCTNAAAGPGVNDIVGGGVTSGPQNGQSVRWTWGQVWTGLTLTSPIIINGTINSLNAPLAGLYGGTGVANSGDTITLGGNISTGGAFTISGAHSLTFTLTGDTSLTLPTSGGFLSSALTSAHLFVGNGSNVATDTALSGDVAITNAGVATVSKIGGTSISVAGTAALGSSTITVGGGTYYGGHSLIGVQVFPATATYTPDAGTNRVIIEVQAPGGGSGGCAGTSSSQSCVSGSGGGGAYAKALCTSNFSGITMTIGASGAAGATGANAGGVGGTTSAGALISAPGGNGGGGGGASNATTFTVNTNGVANTSLPTVSGCTALQLIAGSGSGNGFIISFGGGTQLAGAGGNSALGQGPPLVNTGSTFNGASGTGYGWGAGGAINDLSQSGVAGLAGGPGLIIVEEYN